MKFYLCFISLLANFAFFDASANTILEGKVVSVADGDTLTVLDNRQTPYKVRLLGIDAPEKSRPLAKNPSNRWLNWHMAKTYELFSTKKTNTDVSLDKCLWGRWIFVINKSNQAWLGITKNTKTSSRSGTGKPTVPAKYLRKTSNWACGRILDRWRLGITETGSLGRPPMGSLHGIFAQPARHGFVGETLERQAKNH
jgi:hypothetical protein